MTGAPGETCLACGQPLGEGDNDAELHRRCALDPPRFCARCGGPLRVQILPQGYRARCPACDRAGRTTLTG